MSHPTFRDPAHPLWKICTLLAGAVLIFSVNFFNAKAFDADDWVRITELVGGWGVINGVKAAVVKGGKEDGRL